MQIYFLPKSQKEKQMYNGKIRTPRWKAKIIRGWGKRIYVDCLWKLLFLGKIDIFKYNESNQLTLPKICGQGKCTGPENFVRNIITLGNLTFIHSKEKKKTVFKITSTVPASDNGILIIIMGFPGGSEGKVWWVFSLPTLCPDGLGKSHSTLTSDSRDGFGLPPKESMENKHSLRRHELDEEWTFIWPAKVLLGFKPETWNLNLKHWEWVWGRRLSCQQNGRPCQRMKPTKKQTELRDGEERTTW